MQKFKEALAKNDAQNARIYVHSIKGASMYMGASRVHTMAKTLETYCAHEELDNVTRNLSTFEEEIKQTIRVLQDYKQTC
mmetsp:Transcript_478/g.556  ORF Transcript_478/g.556 Transcript_478/m.556 type:complete len:80 (+) Transcript_478:134-373(+)